MTPQERARDILQGVLGKEPTQDQILRAAEAMWNIDPFTQRQFVDPADPENTQRAENLVRQVRRFFELNLRADAANQAQGEFQDDIDQRAGEINSDFPVQEQPL